MNTVRSFPLKDLFDAYPPISHTTFYHFREIQKGILMFRYIAHIIPHDCESWRTGKGCKEHSIDIDRSSRLSMIICFMNLFFFNSLLMYTWLKPFNGPQSYSGKSTISNLKFSNSSQLRPSLFHCNYYLVLLLIAIYLA